MFTTTNGFGKGESSACQSAAAKRNAAESAWCSAPAVRTWLCKFHSLEHNNNYMMKACREVCIRKTSSIPHLDQVVVVE